MDFQFTQGRKKNTDTIPFTHEQSQAVSIVPRIIHLHFEMIRISFDPIFSANNYI